MVLAGGGPGVSRTRDTRFRKPLLYPSELRGHGRTVACGATGCERGTSVAISLQKPPMYTPVYTTAPHSGSLALLEHAPCLALHEVLGDLCVAHGRLDVGVSHEFLQGGEIAPVREPPIGVRVPAPV